jgi:hypothetical protein
MVVLRLAAFFMCVQFAHTLAVRLPRPVSGITSAHAAHIALEPHFRPYIQPRTTCVRCTEAATAKPSAMKQLSAKAYTALSLGAIIAADLFLRRLFKARSIAFPSSLAGFLLTATGLCTLQSMHPPTAQRIFAAAQPGCAFLTKWLACFFVPNLVLLPLVITMAPSDLGRLCLLILCGVATSLPLAAFSAKLALPSPIKQAEDETRDVFNRYDTDGSIDMDSDELRKALSELGLQASTLHAAQLSSSPAHGSSLARSHASLMRVGSAQTDHTS